MWRFFGDSGKPDSIMPSTLPETWQSNLTRDCDAPVAWTSTPIARKSETTTDSSFWPRRNSRNMRPLNCSCAAHLNDSHRYLSHGWPSKLQPRCDLGYSFLFLWWLSINDDVLFVCCGIAVNLFSILFIKNIPIFASFCATISLTWIAYNNSVTSSNVLIACAMLLEFWIIFLDSAHWIIFISRSWYCIFFSKNS